MKHNPLSRMLYIVTTIAAATLAVNLHAQTNLTGDEALTQIMSNADQSPLNLYPPGYFDWLASVGTNLMPTNAVGPQRPVRDVPVGPLIADDISLDGGFFGMMSMDRPAPTDSAPTYSYNVIDLGTLGGSSSVANAINNANNAQVVGWASNTSQQRPALFTIPVTDLRTFGGNDGLALGINSNGKIVGAAAAGNDLNHAFVWDGALHDLGTLGGQQSAAYAINSSGQITGIGQISGDISHAMLYSGGGPMTDLGTFPSWSGSYGSTGYGIDDFGDIGGVMATNGFPRGFLYTNGMMGDIGTLGGDEAAVYAINSYAEVVGYSTTSTGDHHAMFYDYQNGTMEDLGVLGSATSSDAYGVNNAAHVVGSSGNRAFLVSNGSMQDLNNLVVNNGSGWTLQYATGINDKDQIVGYGLNPSGQTHAFLLNPLPVGWDRAVQAQPPVKTYGIPPTKSADKLVLITHGWTKLFPDQSWINTMSNSIVTNLAAMGVNDWQVYGYYWKGNSSTFNPDTARQNGVQEGISLGKSIVKQGWTNVHFIAHSAGAQLIQTATELIKSDAPETVVQCTFLDPFVGFDKAGVATYGTGVDWSDRYASHNDIDAGEGIFTHIPLNSSYNVDITALDPSVGNSGFFKGTLGYVTCKLLEASHGWAIDFYENTITGKTNSAYAGFGFPLSIEAGGWPNAPTQYPVGNTDSVTNLGSAPASCSLLGAAAQQLGIPIDFNVSPQAGKSTTGTVTPEGGKLTLTTGSPAWISIVPTNADPVDLLSFNADFTSGVAGAAGLLSVYWDSEVIGTLDERVIGAGAAQYSMRFPVTQSNSTHVLSFRIDPFTNIQSTVVLTNVMLGQVGVTQPFTLSVTPNTTNGAIVYQLNGESGFDYGLQASSNLLDWTQIAILENTNGSVTFFDEASTNYPMRFYRAVAPF